MGEMMLHVAHQRRGGIAVKSIQAKIEISRPLMRDYIVYVNAKEHDDEKPSCPTRNCIVSATIEASLGVNFKKKPVRLMASPLISSA